MQSGDKNLERHFHTCNQRATCRSNTTQNELINIIGDQILRKIVDGCKQSRYFIVIADELQDIFQQGATDVVDLLHTGEGGWFSMSLHQLLLLI